jgi:hypothetical protein
MLKHFYTCVIASFFLLSIAKAQIAPPETFGTTVPGCGYVEDPEIRQYTREIINRMYSNPIAKNNQRSLAVYKIPVVVHVMESGAVPLITNAEIQNFITNLNTAYRGTGYYSGSPDIEIEFELAKWDPSCAPTNGITRYDASGNAQYVAKGVFGTGVSWATVQSWRTWNKSMYMNIWIVNKLDNGAAGVGGPSEGLINLASAVTGTHDYVTPHEVGHYLGVAHPFPSSSGSCDCGDGDGLADTPDLMSYGIGSACTHESACSPAAQAATNPCTNSPFGQIQLNIMNYVSGGCDQKFTNDQKNLMRGMLETYHASLLTSPVLSATQPTPSASIVGESTFCTSGTDFPNLAAVCVCGSISSITRNGTIISESDLRAKYLPFPGHSTTRDYVLTCSTGETATKSVTYYNPGVTNAVASCNSATTYSVTFDNSRNYNVTASAGTISGNSVINIPNSSGITLNVTDADGCGSAINVDAPCCAQNLVAAPQCVPTATNGLSIYYGLDNFTFGSINKTSSSSSDDGGNYFDNACSEQTTVNASGSYPISVKGYYTNTHYVKVYIDYNNDGLFTGTSPEEMVFSGTTPGTSNNNTISGNIVIPVNAIRNTRLRVRVLADRASSSNSCEITGSSNGSGQIEDYSVTIADPLPVNLITFEGKAQNTGNQLQWSTSWETQNAGFEIHRSQDAVNFENKGFVDGKQTVTGKSDYQFIDQNVNPGSTYYYRLKQIDRDGSFELSRIIAVKSWYDGLTAYAFPNPVDSDQFTVMLPDINSYSIKMYSPDGVEKPVNLIKTNKENELIITGKEKLSSGLYLLKMTSKNGFIEKVVKVAVE